MKDGKDQQPVDQQPGVSSSAQPSLPARDKKGRLVWRLVVIAVGLFVIETLIMMYLLDFLTLPRVVESFIEGSLLLVALIPASYFLWLRPHVRQKATFEVVKRREEQMRGLFDSSLVGMFIVQDGRFTFVNRQFQELTGYSQGELLGTDPLALVIPEDRGTVRENAVKMLKGQRSSPYEYRFANKAGETRYSMETVAPYYYHGQRAAIGSFMDITEHKLAEMERREHARQMAALHRVSQAISQSLDLEFVSRQALAEALAILGLDAGSAYYIDNAIQEAVRLTDQGLPPEVATDTRRVLARIKLGGQGLVTQAVQSGQPVSVADFTQQTRHPFWAQAGFQSALFLPLKVEDKVVGIISGFSRQRRAFSGADIGMMSSIGSMVGLAIANARLFEQVEAKGREWQQTFDAMADGVAIIGPDHRIQRANQALARMLDATPEALVGQHCYRLIHGIGQPIEKCLLTQCRSEKKSCALERRQPHLGNRWLHLGSDPLVSATGDFLGAVHSVEDITEEKGRQERLREQTRLTGRILASTPNAVLVIAKDLRIVMANRVFYAFFQVDEGEAEGKTLSEFLPIEGLAEAVSRTLASKAPVEVELRHNVRNRERVLVAQLSPLRKAREEEEEEEEEEALLILRDATIERATQQQLYHTSRLASIGELASGMAHELNNPLTSVLGYSELLMRVDLPQEVKNDLEVICSEARRAATVVKKLLNFSRRPGLEKARVNLNDTVREMLEMLSYELKVSNIQIVMGLAPELPSIMADPEKLREVFLNIILNAQQAMVKAHGQGTLSVTSELKGDIIRVSFADDGPGIPPENLRRVFDPFFTTKDPGKGTGLGLSICHSIVTEHGGRIYAESEAGKGAAFFVELPTSAGGNNAYT